MPVSLPKFSSHYFKRLDKKSFPEMCIDIARALLQEEIPGDQLEKIVTTSFNFEVPLIELNDNVAALELFHGPSLAFKDFGARFMSRIMSYLHRNENRELTILVATSGDTGGAVASGFYNIPGINVVILYPRFGVSPLQEKQLTTFGQNITSIAIDGTFDDCQYLVKRLLDDKLLRGKLLLSSANSINIARLLPQSFYYFEIIRQSSSTKPLAVSIPSGNFGNLTAGLFAREMGAPIAQIIAATNVNDVVPNYLKTGHYHPKPSITTLSNAMDVGNPSNFSRILSLYGSTWNKIKQHILGYSFQDKEITAAITTIHQLYNYIMDPHGAVGFLALEAFLKQNRGYTGVFLETAHPAKFYHLYDTEIQEKIHFPPSLVEIQSKPSYSYTLPNQYNSIKMFLLDNQ